MDSAYDSSLSTKWKNWFGIGKWRAVYQSSGEGEIRKKIIEDDLIEGIIAMPTQLFYSVTIPVTLWFISKNKKQKGKTLFIDARKMGYMVDRKHRDFTDEDIKKLAYTFNAFQGGTLKM